jgi:hypothetical protein
MCTSAWSWLKRNSNLLGSYMAGRLVPSAWSGTDIIDRDAPDGHDAGMVLAGVSPQLAQSKRAPQLLAVHVPSLLAMHRPSSVDVTAHQRTALNESPWASSMTHLEMHVND